MVPNPRVTVRPLHAMELDQATRWAVAEGWNPGPHDGVVLNHADPGSLIALEVEGRAAGVISAVRLAAEFGYLGFFVVCHEHRRLGYGCRLLRAGFQRLGERTIIGGDAELDHLRGYARFGLLPRHQNISYEGLAPAYRAKTHPAVLPAEAFSAAELQAYDATNFGVSRGAFLIPWMTSPNTRALVFAPEGRVAGFVAARRCHRGVRIGPLQADHPEAAEALLDTIASFYPGEILAVDCPETNQDASALLRKKGFSPQHRTARVYRGEPPPGRPAKIYGLMSFALG